MTTSFEDLRWELYDHRTDPSENTDLAEVHPKKLRELTDAWWAAAGRYQVLPVDSRPRSERWPVNPPTPAGTDPAQTVFLGSSGPFERGVAPKIAGRSFRLSADINVGEDGAEGVLYSLGGAHGGYCWYLRDGKICLEVAQSSVQTQTVCVPATVPAGRHELQVTVLAADDLTGRAEFMVDGDVIGTVNLTALLKRVPIGCGRTYVGHTASSTVSRVVVAPDPFTGELLTLTVVSGDRSLFPLREELRAEMRDQ